MDVRVKGLWISALLSGEYPQGSGRLRTKDDRYCCLGVLCDQAAKEGIGEWSESGGMVSGYRFGGVVGLLPNSVCKWAGLEMPNPAVKWHDGYISLATLNDEKKLSFREIAELIRINF